MNNENFQEYYTLHKGILIIVSGPSGAGKSQICRSYISNNQDTILSISETTRAPRKGEKHGKEYYFITEEEFEEKQKNGYYLESAGIYEKHYGTPKGPIVDNLKKGHDVILEIDPQGAEQVVKQIPDAVTVFIVPSSFKILEEQIRNRKTETEEQIQLRLSKTKKELEYIKNYDYIIVNRFGKMVQSVQALKDIVKAEKLSVQRILNQYGVENEDK